MRKIEGREEKEKAGRKGGQRPGGEEGREPGRAAYMKQLIASQHLNPFCAISIETLCSTKAFRGAQWESEEGRGMRGGGNLRRSSIFV